MHVFRRKRLRRFPHIFSKHEIQHIRLPGNSVFLLLEPAIHPADHQLVHLCRFAAGLRTKVQILNAVGQGSAMEPGTHHQLLPVPDLRIFLSRQVLTYGSVLGHIKPPREMKHCRLHVLKPYGMMSSAPEGFLLRALHKLYVILKQLNAIHLRRLRILQRKGKQKLSKPRLVLLQFSADPLPPLVLHLEKIKPCQGLSVEPVHMMASHCLILIHGKRKKGCVHIWTDGFQVRRPSLRRRILRPTEIGQSVHSHVSVTPGLCGRPLDRVVSILHLALSRGNQDTFGPAASSCVLYQQTIPALHPLLHIRVEPFLRKALLIVRCPHDHHGKSSALVGPVQVPGQNNPVPHGDGQIFFYCVSHNLTP